jgi:transcriptional antiterminator
VTRQLARQIIEAEPHLSRSEVAARLGLSTRRLREILATPA